MQNDKKNNIEFLEESKAKELLYNSKDIMAHWLDTKKGCTVTDHSIFSTLAREYFIFYFYLI